MEIPSSHVPAAPAVSVRSAGEPPDNPGSRALGKGRSQKRGEATFDVLVVEDEPETREAMLEMLAMEGYEALAAANGLQALLLLERGDRPSLILLDLLMPTMDGWEFCRELALRPALSNIPVAIVSATGQERILPERKLNAGLFRKPFDMPHLLKTIRIYCD